MNRPIRILVIDDSAYNRQTITSLLEQAPGVQVVGRAVDGEEGLKLAFQLLPDVITLDLEMPKMDGFSFLRILMSKKPMPVIVISGHSTRENVFKALELGALDFVAKPSRNISPELKQIKDELLQKVRLVTQLRVVSLADRAQQAARQGATASGVFVALPNPQQPVAPLSRKEGPAPARVIAIGASTGGPPAIHQLLGQLDPEIGAGLVLTQHMPAKFTRAFAERLDRTTPWRVREAEPGDAVTRGVALVAPGAGSIVVRRNGAKLECDVVPQQPDDRFVPSIDRMLESAARAMGKELLAVVLTGMGGDGGRGVRAVKAQGGRIIAESPESAVIAGMPQEAIATGAVDEVLPLAQIADAMTRFARR